MHWICILRTALTGLHGTASFVSVAACAVLVLIRQRLYVLVRLGMLLVCSKQLHCRRIRPQRRAFRGWGAPALHPEGLLVDLVS